MEKFITFCRYLGLHPMVAVAMIAVDTMLFGTEIVSIGTSIPLSVIVAAALVIPCTLMQRYGFKDDWGQAIGKSMIVCIVTAIPTPLPSVATGAAGVLGTIGLLTQGVAKAQIQQSDLNQQDESNR